MSKLYSEIHYSVNHHYLDKISKLNTHGHAIVNKFHEPRNELD